MTAKAGALFFQGLADGHDQRCFPGAAERQAVHRDDEQVREMLLPQALIFKMDEGDGS